MDLSFLTNAINPVILGICLMVGYVIKLAIPKIPNRYIPLSALAMGTILGIIINWPGINAEVILGGMISSLASTGLYEMMRNLLDKDGKKRIKPYAAGNLITEVMNMEKSEKQQRKKSNSVTQKVKVENQNQTHNVRKEGIAPINQKR